MIKHIVPKLPMRNKAITKTYYVNNLGFEDIGGEDYDGYLILELNGLELHFFESEDLDPYENDGQVYIRTERIESFYQSLVNRSVAIHPTGHLRVQPWGQKEFAILDPDHNLLTFGQAVKK